MTGVCAPASITGYPSDATKVLLGDGTWAAPPAGSTIPVVDAAGDTTTFPLLAGAATGTQAVLSDLGLTYNSNTNALTAATFVGALTGNADTVTTNANLTGPITSVGNATTVADAELAALAGLTSAADKLPYFTGAGTASVADFTAAGRALVDDATAAAQATTLGLGTADSPQLTAINLGHASDTTIARASAGDITIEGNGVYRAGGTDVPIADGGTGASTAAAAATALGVGTGDSPQLTAINLGHASDTTIARASAGQITVEGTAVLLSGGALGTPSSGVATNLTGTAASLTAGTVTTNANLTGPITSVGNATTVADGELSAIAGLTSAADKFPYFTGSGTAALADLSAAARTFLTTPSGANLAALLTDETGSGLNVHQTSPTLVTPLLGTPTSGVMTNLTGINAWSGYVYTTSDQTAIGTSYVDITALTFAVIASGVYLFEFTVWADADATTTGIDIACNGPAIGAGTIVYTQRRWGSATADVSTRATAYNNDSAAANSCGATAQEHQCRGILVNGVNAGNLTCTIKRENVGTGPNVRAGSWGRIQRIA